MHLFRFFLAIDALRNKSVDILTPGHHLHHSRVMRSETLIADHIMMHGPYIFVDREAREIIINVLGSVCLSARPLTAEH